jgi:hypothetical protein
MPSRYEELKVGFSTADVQDVCVSFTDRTLAVEFADWQGKKTNLVFRNVAGFKWDDTSFQSIDVSPDRAYRVLNSDWLSTFSCTAGFTHFALGFCGQLGYAFLDVIATALEEKKA